MWVVLFHILKKKNQKSSLVYINSPHAPLYEVLWRFIPEISSLLLLPSYALLLCPWHWRKIRNITTWKSTERARAISLSHSLTSSKSKNPNFCMKMKYLRHTCSLQYGDVGRRGRGRDYWNLIEILNYCKNVFFWDSNQFKSRL